MRRPRRRAGQPPRLVQAETIYDAAPLDDPALLGVLRSALRQFEPAVIHLDPLYAFQPATVDTNRLGDVGRMLSEAQMMCFEAGATIWITAHMNQSWSGSTSSASPALASASGATRGRCCAIRPTRMLTPASSSCSCRWAPASGAAPTYDLDFNIGRFDPALGHHDGPITFTVSSRSGQARPGRPPTPTPTSGSPPAAPCSTPAAGRAVRSAAVQIVERSTGAADKYLRAEFQRLIDESQFVVVGAEKPTCGGCPIELLQLSKDAG